MANTTIDTLEVKIKANAESATKSLGSLADALRRVNNALRGVSKDGSTTTQRISRGISDLNNALQGINSAGIKRLNEMSSAIHKYASAVSKAKGLNVGPTVTKSIKDVNKALDVVNSTATSKAGTKAVGKPEELSSADKEQEINSKFLRSSGVFSGAVNAQELKEKNDALRQMGVFSSKAQSNVSKLGDEFKKTTKKLREMSLFSGKFFKSIARIAMYRAIRTALKAIGEAFSEGLKNAYQYSKQSETFTRLAETLDHLKSIVAQMVNQIGAFWGEFKQFIAPAVNWLIEKVRKISEGLTELFAALNGQKTYLQAQYVAQEWGEAAEAVNKYKHQLLGLDELNNLSANKGGKDDEVDYSKLYKEVSVSEGLLKVGEQWTALKEKIVDTIQSIETALGGFMIGVGAVLLFSGANIPLGLGLLIAGGFMAGKEIAEKWNTLYDTLGEKIGAIEILLGGVMAGVGAVLAFSGANIPLGIGLIVAGAGIFAAGEIGLNWNKLNKNVKKKVTRLTTIVSGALLAIGAVLAFSGTNLPLGIGMMAAGAVGLATVVALNWDSITTEVENAFKKLAPLFALTGIGTMAVGAILLFTGHIGLGLGLLVAGGFLTASTIAINWDSILESLQGAWDRISNWWNTTVVPKIEERAIWVKDKIDKLREQMNPESTKVTTPVTKTEIQLNPVPDVLDAISEDLGKNPVDSATEKASGVFNKIKKVITDTIDDAKTLWGEVTYNFENSVVGDIFDWMNGKSGTQGGGGHGFATGGIPTRGTLFYAGENGSPEWVGTMGGNTAVANTSQMTEAIYKAAYMGMSRALQENGGNGLAGFVPATTDDLFIAMRKKASNYNKATGNSAFA